MSGLIGATDASDGLLWISYYSSHDGKASVYLAQVRIYANDFRRGPIP